MVITKEIFEDNQISSNSLLSPTKSVNERKGSPSRHTTRMAVRTPNKWVANNSDEALNV